MKTSLSSLDITALVAEISPNIVGSWVNNIYSIGKNLVILRFRKTTETTSEFIFELGKRFHLTKYVRKKPSTPNNKVMSLRKHIRDLPVKNFYQKGLDRVVVFEIAYKDSFYKLVLELFGEGNLILVGPNNKIILAYNYRRMKDRDIHPGKEFVFPPSPTENILTITKESFFNKMGQYEGKIITFLNTVLGLGPQYSKDIMLKTKISAKTVDALEPKDKDLLYLKVEELKEIIESKNFTYYRYMDDSEVVDITPISFARYKDLEEQIVDSFNNALDDFFSSQEEEPDFAEDKTETTGKISKLKKILDDQQSHLQALIKQEALEKKKGDLLYAYFSEVDELLKTILDARKSGIPWEEILTKLEQGKRQGIKSALLIERVEPKNKKLTVKLKDEGKEVLSFDIDFTKSLVENANLFYEKSKKARRKIPGAEAAIKRTKKLIEETESKKEDIVKIEETKPLVVKRPKKWYEKFHWFICDDKIVIGGKDVKSNERILKTYLDDNDLFFHADVHGSPYVVVKEGLEGLSDECKRQVGIFALAYSSLWKDKKLVGDVYFVSPEQVSLSPPSGQYLAKGSVMIYGEKNYLKNLEINHAVGIILHESYAQVIGGPRSSVEARAHYFIQLKPGSLQKGKVAREIREKMFKLCPEEEKYKLEALTINDFLPFIPGDSEIVE